MPVRPQRPSTPVAALLVVVALALCACSAADSSDPVSAPSGSGSPVTACGVDVPPKAPSPRFAPTGRVRGTVGVLLPTPGSGAPSAAPDGALLTKALRARGLTPVVDNAAPGSEEPVLLARSLVGDGIRLLVVVALALCACSAADSSDPVSAPSGSGSPVTACGVDVPPKAPSPRFASTGRVRGTVGVLLPTPGSGSPSATPDGVLLTKALRARGLTPVVDYAAPGSEEPVLLARSLVGDGLRLLVVGALGRGQVIRVERIADRAGVEVVEYGGVTLGGSAPYYVSFDYQEIGRQQAQTMVSCLTAAGVTDPRIVMVDGGTDVDENATLMALGAHQVLDQLVTSGQVRMQGEATVKGWDAARAGPAFEQALDAADGRVDGVLAANDTIADAVTGVLRRRGLEAAVVTGQSSGAQGLRNVLSGRQSMTVLTDPAGEADAAARLAAAVVSGSAHALASAPLTPFTDPLVPTRGLAGVLVPATAVTQADLEDVVRAGGVTTDVLCRGLLRECAALGVS